MNSAQLNQWSEFQPVIRYLDMSLVTKRRGKGRIEVKIFKILLGVILMFVLTSCGDNEPEPIDNETDACVHVKAGLNSCNCTCGDVCVIWRDAGSHDSNYPYDTDLAECVAPSSD